MDRSLEDNMPIYMQIMNWIRDAIASGELAAGDKVPSVREFASEFEVNPNTMQKAFAELERSGLILTQRTAGRTVTEDKDMIASIKLNLAKEQMETFLTQMKKLGFTREEIVSLIQKLQ